MISKDSNSLKSARKFLKNHIKFINDLRNELNSDDELVRIKAFAVTYCVNQYIFKEIFSDIEKLLAGLKVAQESNPNVN